MKTKNLFVLSLVLTAISFTSCEQEDALFIGIDEINVSNYPRVDGSTSTDPLNTLIACKLLGWRYEWQRYVGGSGIILFFRIVCRHFIVLIIICYLEINLFNRYYYAKNHIFI